LLTGVRGLDLIGEASSGPEAVRLCRRLHPNLVIMDVRLPDMDGLTATRAIRQALPDCQVLVFSMDEPAEYLRQAVRAGAAGYLLKGSTRRELLNAVREALSPTAMSPSPEDQPDAKDPSN
jgi:DNA-binding NarL/FixJ family response regulator